MKTQPVPTLLHRVRNNSVTLSIVQTNCIVTQFGRYLPKNDSYNVLVNPSNPHLTGVSQFTYFPRGGPVPSVTASNTSSMHKDWQPLGYVSQWGGMNVGKGMMYPVSVIDGLVHLYGGPQIARECAKLREQAQNSSSSSSFYMDPIRHIKRIFYQNWNYSTDEDLLVPCCPTGTVRDTTSGKLQDENTYNYHRILHATPPFYKNADTNPQESIQLLHQLYRSIFEWLIGSSQSKPNIHVAIPLIGAGCRGFPVPLAMQIAVDETRAFFLQPPLDAPARLSIYFVLPGKDDAQRMKLLWLQRNQD